MPVTIREFRKTYPQYDDMNDTVLAKALHQKYYSDLPFEEVSEKFSVFDPEGSGYDYETAEAHGLKPDETGHWPSRSPKTGQILKGQKHRTYNLTVKGERDAGFVIRKEQDGKYYSQPQEQLPRQQIPILGKIDKSDPIFQLSQRIREANTQVVKDYLGLTKPEPEPEKPFQPSLPADPSAPGIGPKPKPRDILRASRDEDINFIYQAVANDPLAIPDSVGKLVVREQRIRQEMQSLSQESKRSQNIIFALSNWSNLFNVNEYLDRQGLNPFSKGQFAITLEAVNRLVAERPLSVKDVALEFGVHAPKILLEFAALPDVGSKIKMLEKTPRLKRILLTGLKFATREAVQAPGVEETLAERSRRVLGAGGFGAAVGAAGEFIPRTAIRAPITIGGAGLLTLAQGGSKEDVIKTMATIAGFEALGLIKRASRATDARIRKRLENKAIKAIRQQGKVKGIDLSKVPEDALREFVKSNRQITFWQRQFDKGKITRSVLDDRLSEQTDKVRPILKAIARQQPIKPPTERPAAEIRALKPKKGITVPLKPVRVKPEAIVKIGKVAEIEKEVQRAGITAEDFELKPDKMKGLGLEKIAMKVKGKIFAFKYGEKGVFNHADVLQKSGAPADIKTEDIVPGFIDTKGRFVEQFERPTAAEEPIEKIRREEKELSQKIDKAFNENDLDELRRLRNKARGEFGQKVDMLIIEVGYRNLDKLTMGELRNSARFNNIPTDISREEMIQRIREVRKIPEPKEPVKEIKDEKEAITEPTTHPEMEPEKAGKLVPTGKLDPTKETDALEIIERHKSWLAEGGDIAVGGIFKTKWEAGKGELEAGGFVISSVEYTSEQIDAAYRTIQKPVPSLMADTELFAMPGKEAQIQVIAQKMQKIKGVSKRIKRTAKLTRPPALPKAKTEKADHIKAIYQVTAKETTRYAINGILVEGENIVATDGRRIFWAKGKWGKDGLYLNPASLKNGLLGKSDKKGLKFPKWRDIVPDVSSEKPIYVDSERAWSDVRRAAILTTEESRGITVIANKDGSLGFAAAAPEVGHVEINVNPGGKILGGVNPQFLLDVIRFHATRGNDAFEFYFPDWQRPILTKSFDGKTNTVTMPINIGDPVDISKPIKEAIREQGPIQRAKDKAQATGKTQKIIKEGKEIDVVPGEDVAIVDEPGALGAAETIPEIDASLRPKGKPVSSREIIFQMERDFGVPFRSKITHIFRKKIAHFQVKSKLIRSIDVRNLSTATHELGHHLDRNFFGNIRKHPPPRANQELLDMGKALYGKRKPPGGYKSEGVAEYMRMWLTDNDAENRAPNFTKWFKKYLKDNPDVAKRLNRTRQLIEKWKAQGAVARVESQIVIGKVTGGVAERIGDAIRLLETLTLDRFAPLRRLRDEIGANQFKPSEDPFVVATANATKAGAKAAFFALEGTTDLAGNITGISLQEALAPVSRNIKNWQTWAVAARARHLLKLGINPGISKTDADFVFEQFKTPEFEKALDEFTKWNHRGLDYMVEAGAIEKSVVDRIKKRHPVYVPFKRAFKEGEIQQKFVPNKGFVETGSPIKKIKGSGRAIKDPIQEAMKGMESMMSTAQKAQVALAMAKLADRFPGVGKHIVRIPAPKVPTTFSAEQIKGDIIKIAVQKLGIDPTEINIAQVMDTWDEDLTVFTKGFKFTGKENVISIVRNGTRLFYEVSPDLFKTLKGLDKFTLPWYLDFWMGKANRALKLGATGLNPDFALRNFIRDLQTFGFTTEFAKGNFFSGVKGIGKDVVTDFSGIAEKFGIKIPKSQDVLRFRALGGELATFILQDKTGVKHLKSTVLASDGTKYIINTFLHPIHVLRELVGITEVGTRIGEFGPALREGERRYGKGTADATMFALNAAQDVTVNFSRMGTLFQILNQVIPFSNVAVQGPAKIFRTIRKRPFRSIRRAMIGLTIPAIWLWWRNKDKKWWKSLPAHERGNYLHFENPKNPNEIFRFPVAFELGHIFQTLPVVALDAIYQNDPSDITPMLEFVVEQANPIDWPAAIGPIIDAKENKDFAGRPIVPRSVEGRLPEDRFTPRSTALMKFIGRKLKVSPAQLDFLANTYSGGLYGRVARTLSFTTDAPETKRDLPIIGTLFLRDPFAPRKEIERFYNRLELLSQKNQSKKITTQERREFLIRTRIARAISPRWKLLRDAKAVKKRKMIYSKIREAIDKGDAAINRTAN